MRLDVSKKKPLSEEVQRAAEHPRPHDLPLRHTQSLSLTRTYTLFHLANTHADLVLAVHQMQWFWSVDADARVEALSYAV